MQNPLYPKWQSIKSHYVVNDRWLKLRVETFLTPSGATIAPYYISELVDWVNCLVIDKDNNVLLVRHYRPAVDIYILETVSGWVDQSDTTPSSAIIRELQEELGYKGGELFQTGISYTNPANQTNKLHSFLAIGGSRAGTQQLESGETLHIESVPLSTFLNMFTSVNQPETYQGLHLATIFLALNYIRQADDSSVGLKTLKTLI